MTQAEIYAEDNGLIGIYFETWDFQARPFYEKLGYTVLANCQIAHLVLHFIL